MGISLKSLFTWGKKQEKDSKEKELEERLAAVDQKTSRTLTGISMIGVQSTEVAEKCARPRLPSPDGAAPKEEMRNPDSVASKIEKARQSVMLIRGDNGKLEKIVG